MAVFWTAVTVVLVADIDVVSTACANSAQHGRVQQALDWAWAWHSPPAQRQSVVTGKGRAAANEVEEVQRDRQFAS